MTTRGGKLNVGIVGLGHLHPRLYMPLFENCRHTRVVSVCEPNSKLLKAFCDDYDINGYTTLSSMLRAEELDMAAIFLPHVDCANAGVACAKKGIHLMVEKPIAESSRSAARIVKAAKANKVKLTTGYCWRMHPVVVEIKKLIEKGVLGRIVGVEGRIAAGRVDRYVQGNSGWMLQKAKSGGGPMYNLGVHWIDLLRYIFSDEVTEACGRNVKVNNKYDIEDNSFAQIIFKKGVIASLDISYTVPDSFPHGRDLYIGIRGTRGVISWSPGYEGQKDILFVCSDEKEFAGAGKRETAFELDSAPGYSGYMGQAYVDDFANAILKNKTPLISGEDGVAVLKIVEAIYKSDKEKRWVKVKK